MLGKSSIAFPDRASTFGALFHTSRVFRGFNLAMSGKTHLFAMLKKQFFLLLMLAAFTLPVHAQMVDWHWDTHGVAFQAPSSFKITTNNAEEFSAENDKIALSIIPVQDENITEDHLSEAVTAMAKELNYDVITKAAKAEVDDFVGSYIVGKKEGVNALVMALLDTESSTNLLVVIIYANGMEKQAEEIANSFEAYDEK